MALKGCISALENTVQGLRLEEADQARMLRTLQSAGSVLDDLAQIDSYSEKKNRALSESLDALERSCQDLQGRG